MCVTAGSATMTNTLVYGYVPPIEGDGTQRHITGYQNQAKSLSGPNCMLLNYAGIQLRLVRGPERTKTMMADMTARLTEVEEVFNFRSGRGGTYGTARVENYGDYTVVISQSPGAIADALDAVPLGRRPVLDMALTNLLRFFGDQYPNDTFVLACFDGTTKVKPTHPIVVSYVPRQPEFITVPGLDGHDGAVPQVGSSVYRNFKVAFGIHGVDLYPVTYKDDVSPLWAPTGGVVGFVDNREDDTRNGNYCLPTELIRTYVDERTDDLDRRYYAPGTDLVEHLVLSNL